MPKGSIALATGPMYSGKTEWLIEKLSEFDDAKRLAIRFTLDNRYSIDSLASHNGKKLAAKSAGNLEDIRTLMKEQSNIEVLGIDEVQFFEPELAGFLENIKQTGIQIFTSGLNVDYLATPWETTVAIEKISDEVINVMARCNVCGKNNAVYTQRIGETTDRVAVGGTELYEARCEEHYVAIA